MASTASGYTARTTAPSTSSEAAAARKYLSGVDGRRLTCPGVADLCQKVGDYRTLAEVAREQNDVVHFLAGLLAAK